MTRLKILGTTLACLIGLGSAIPVQAELVTYPRSRADADLPLSSVYEVTVEQGGVTRSTVVYQSLSNGSVEGGRNDAVKTNSIAWTQFSFSGTATVTVKLKSGQSKVQMTTPVILPSRHGVQAEKVDAQTVRFVVTKPSQYSVEVSPTAFAHGLMIFADPLETSVPDPKSATVKFCNPCNADDLKDLAGKTKVYFADTSHTILHWSIPANIKEIYLAGGSVVKGAILMDGSTRSGVKIHGRGTLDGRVFGLDKIHMIEAVNGANDIWVEGLVISQASAFNVRLLGTDNDIHWVKTPGGWRFNNDGLVGYARTRISNCFVWANDDGIKLYRDDQTVSDIVAWHLTNGGVFQWCWSAVSAKNIRVQRVDVIRGQWPSDGQNQGVFNVRGSQSAGAVQVQEDWVFDDIRVETPVAVLFNLAPQVDHIVRDVTFRNVQAKVTANVINRIEGHSAAVPLTDVTLEGLRLNGTCINPSNASSTGKFQIANAQRVTFAGCSSTGIEGRAQPSSRNGNGSLDSFRWSVQGRDLGGRIVSGP
jgi:hypothetical protein